MEKNEIQVPVGVPNCLEKAKTPICIIIANITSIRYKSPCLALNLFLSGTQPVRVHGSDYGIPGFISHSNHGYFNFKGL